MRALTRRRAGRSNPELSYADLSINPATRTITYKGAPVHLSAREFALLLVLIDQPGRVMSRAQLEERLYGWNEEIGSNAIEVYVHGLRKKLGPDFIKNVRGIGYKLGLAA